MALTGTSPVTGTTPDSDTNNNSDSKNTSKTTLSTTSFLELIVDELRYQDPLEPQSNSDFAAQLAQMSTLEQIQGISSSIAGSQASDMIGKYIGAEVLDSKTGVTTDYAGVVQGVEIVSGVPYVVVNGKQIPLASVSEIYDPSIFKGGNDSSGSSGSSPSAPSDPGTSGTTPSDSTKA